MIKNSVMDSLPSKEFFIFKQLCDHEEDTINLESLLIAYRNITTQHNIESFSDTDIINMISGIKLSGEQVFSSYDRINYRGFTLIYKHLLSNLLKYESPIRPHLRLQKNIFDLRKYSMLIATLFMDIVCVSLLCLSKSYPPWILVARSFALIILVNMFYLMLPLTGASNLFPNSIVIQMFPSEYTEFYHRIFGSKIIIASIGHIIGHIGQIENVLTACRNGCSREYIKIAPPSSGQTIISRSFFIKQYAYASGIILTALFGAITILLMIRKHMRISLHQLLHKYLGFSAFVMIVAHGAQQLLGFNLSLILTLPLLVFYVWKHRREFIHSKIQIERWVITPSLIRLYLKEDIRIENTFSGFNIVSIYVNYSDISKLEWHPFTLSRNQDNQSCVLTMKRVGEWTNKLANALSNRIHFVEYLNLGNITRSQFRYHKFYKVRYFFCAGIGITSFISAMEDTLHINYRPVATTLIWSISDVNFLKEFNVELMSFKQRMPDLKIFIYYSNRFIPQKSIEESTRLRFVLLQTLIHHIYKIDIFAGSTASYRGVALPVCCILQRADIYSILEGAIWRHRSMKSEVGIFVCGSNSYGNTIREYVNIISRNDYKVRFRVWMETC